MSTATATIPPEIVAALEKLAVSADDRVFIEVQYVRDPDGTLHMMHFATRPDYLPRRLYFGNTLDEAVAAAMTAQKRVEHQS